jgi:hypothetical protein
MTSPFRYDLDQMGGPEKASHLIDELKEFLVLAIELRNTASKHTHYKDLDSWSNKVYDFIHKKLKRHGFVNGEPELNRKNLNASVWRAIYGGFGSIVYSPHLKTEVSLHHSSAFERNEALVLELDDLVLECEKYRLS